MGNPFTVSLIGWHDGEPLLRSIREAVFIHEQGIPDTLEWDGLDENARHALALSLQGNAIGCGRILPNGHIGHIAVLPQWRRQKAGTAIMEALLDYARTQGYPQVSADAQPSSMPFYRKFGFAEQGEALANKGLQEIRMFLNL